LVAGVRPHDFNRAGMIGSSRRCVARSLLP
jgi:hypothetical protein